MVEMLVANFLLPYVKDGLSVIAKKVAAKADEAAGEEAASVTGRVWIRVRELFSTDPKNEQVFRHFEEDPDGTAMYLQKLLRTILENDPAAAEELAALAKTPAPGSDQSIANVIANSGVTITITDSTLTGSPTTGVSYAPPRDPSR